MNPVLEVLGFALFGYLAGSLPFSIWITKWIKGVDVRSSGSKHATATNTIRQAGWLAGAAVLVLDVAKAFLPTYLAIRYGPYEWVAPLTAALAVIGHCWPILAGFQGGMGLAAAAGGILAHSLLIFAIGLGILIILLFAFHHAARASLITGLLLWILILALGFPIQFVLATAGTGAVIAVRFLRDWKREYRELWLDREQRAKE
jgi:acyl phosphate:glycerol-3-phosphate acyltransferase